MAKDNIPVSIVGSLSNQGVDVDSATKALLALLVGATGNKLAINPDGSINVSGITVNSLTATNVGITGKVVTPVTLQSAAVAAGNGTVFAPATPQTLTFVISGTSTSRTVVFEIADPVKGVYQNLALATKLGDTSFTPQQQTTGGNDTTPEIWEVDIPANFSFRARISAVAGGNVSISGGAVSQ